MKRWTKWALGGIGGASLLVGAAVQLTRHRYEEPSYRLLAEHGPLQIRGYDPKVVARTVVTGDDERAATREGFRRLAGYIFGANGGEREIAMTTPVERRQASEAGSTIAMTTPVETGGRRGSWEITFTMPSEYSLEALPRPDDARVELAEVPGQTLAVLRFAGRVDDAERSERTQELEALLEAHGYQPVGEPTLAQYDPPWVLGPFRRNEVLVPVAPRP